MINLKHNKLLNFILLIGVLSVSLPILAQSSSSQMEMSQPQGGNAPEGARDPHAYSAGTTLTQGPYAFEGDKRLTLADEHAFYTLIGDRFEYNAQDNAAVFDLQAWHGTTFNRLVIKTEGDFSEGSIEENQTDILWGHGISAYWNTQVGIRFDHNKNAENKQWLAIGLQGLAPYWFEVDMTAYLEEGGNTALTLETEYELLLTQRLIIQSRAEIALYAKEDKQNELGNGLSSSAIGFRLRYEFTRQFAPYIGVEWHNTYGRTAEYAQANGKGRNNTEFIAGVKFWF
ncbi:copper resistance protein B [Pseudoalteromonas sp. MMG010]|uniref:copper resistance protein B n=1 Tax=Pseudoalteromonas sp. MMG010 TaxID=2822685 RepID=UPI001B3A6422|nr:copper resistance protein B [Pseudoalteromonas sp. MMG010]MBQ4833763.1 copper resistance protein B [Pseudoalteromonas sp. MMG010]